MAEDEKKRTQAEKRRQRYAAMTDEQRAELLARNRAYRARKREESPEEYEAGKKNRAAAITSKYQTDEEYRERRREAMRARYKNLTPEERAARVARAAALRAERKNTSS